MVPAATPVTVPTTLIVAIPGDTELHTPPTAVGSLKSIVAVGHTTSEPKILPAAGDGLTVTTAVVAIVPQLLVVV